MSEVGSVYVAEADSADTRREFALRHRNLIRFLIVIGSVMADLGAIAVGTALGALMRQGDVQSSNWLQVFGVIAPTYLLASVALGGYRVRTLRSLSRSLSKPFPALAIAVAFGFTAAFALRVGATFSRLETLYAILFATLLLMLVRAFGVVMLRNSLRAIVQQSAMLLTDGGLTGRRSGDRATRIVDVRAANLVPDMSDPAFLDRVGRLVRDADRVILSFESPAERQKWAETMQVSGHNAELVADLGDVKPLALSHWQAHSTLVISRGPLNLGERVVKRAFDLGVTLMLLPIFGPIIAIFAILVKLDSKGPAFFIQERVGQNNRTYRCFKMRTMRTDLTDTSGFVSASRTDPRITRIGSFLRKTSIDELPQLFNVLNGDMSLVGPRPHALGSRAEGALFWELVPDYWRRHSMKPGVTGLAQVRGLRGATHRRADIERRVAADLEYINGWSLWADVKILIMTFTVMVHRNAY
ncbi:exopolysaccharide biosynthesis polyprenyl glycosylphosphotransferase [Ancylobacter sp. 6x-1]|uniref:Exopolysaccharide biosynthesis polyprenyl glycosylphosphotransferase n=1 Tax=Ancylobacter crimeensis TaxID=2579147 RepID=A0ABT0DGB5_9HYPH|nr:exopolysaccharide biosynthesis polyprenyl glycosylphosphotransferase [Ancylobacter crimeensis]MCK0198997.1 exopolysaccharide biosynthesis polyprenyl glycosylphosphotransferase [Ancylobacter crimeensis]